MSFLKQKISSRRSGFTIVELLIVIVVIAILAAISIVAYNGIQARAREVQLSSDINAIKKTMELYKANDGQYPRCASGGNCSFITDVKSKLVPAHASSLSAYNFPYVYYEANPDQWGMLYYTGQAPYGVPGTCKFGANMNPAWYNSVPECK